MADEFEKGLGGLESGPGQTGGAAPERGPATDVEHPAVNALRGHFGDAILRHELHAGDEHVVFVAAERVLEIMRWLREDADQRFDFLADLTAVDYGGGRPLQVVYQLWSIPNKQALRLKAELPLDALRIDSVVPVWQTANWLEREVYDLFGVEFVGHPDLRRIMMPDNYAEGHPLRKDFPLRGRFSRAEQTRRALAFDLADYYAPSEMEAASRGTHQESEQRADRTAADEAGFPPDTAESRDPRDAGEDEEQG